MKEAAHTNGGMAFGRWLKQHRKAIGLTQKDLAQGVGCSVVTIEKIESGERRPSSQIAELLAEYVNVPLDERRAFVEFSRAQLSPAQIAVLAQGDSIAPWRTLHHLTSNLPSALNTFIGRVKELEAARSLLMRPNVRLVSMTGPPGIGKTRLALQLAEEMVGEFEGGVFFVALAPIRDPDLVAPYIARVLGVRESGAQTPLDTLKNYLAAKRMLLVLDNFEQVISAASLVADLLSAARWLKVLVTTREVLHIYGEHEFPVPPMARLNLPYTLPVERLMECEAVRLFAERARAVRPDFTLSRENAHAVLEICTRLDRLPLAIELAAARVKVMSPNEMLSRLESRLELLMGGARDVPARQRALRSAIDWSYDLLSDDERMVFRCMAVFDGGCTAQAAHWACQRVGLHVDAWEVLGSLLDKNLLRQEEMCGELRFLMLETIREYALWRLEESGEAEMMRQHHTDYFVAMAEQARSEMKGAEQAKWLDRLECEHANFRSALRWSLERGDAETALLLGGALWRFWLTHGHLTEGRKWLALALAQSRSAPPLVRANALGGAGNLACSCGDYKSAQPLYEESLAIRRELGDKPGIASSLNNLALIAHTQCDYPRVRALHEESLVIKRELGDEWGIASSLGNLAIAANDQGDHESARALHEESLVIRRKLGDRLGVALSLLNLGTVFLEQGDYATAQALFDESLAIRKELGDKPGIAECLVYQGEVAQCQGNFSVAGSFYQQSLDICRELGDAPGIADALVNLGHVAHRQGRARRAAALYQESLTTRRGLSDMRGIIECLAALAGIAGTNHQPQRAATLFGAAETLLNSTGFHLHRVDRIEYERNLAAVRIQLGEREWLAAYAEGAFMPPEDAIAYALSA